MEPPPPTLETQPPAIQPPRMSLLARLLNIFATPGEVFDDVKNSPPTMANWLVPAVLMSIVGAISAFIIFSQPAVAQQIREHQRKVIDQQVEAGKLTREKADEGMAAIERMTGLMPVFGSVGAVTMSFVQVFAWAFMLWLIGRFLLKADIGYLKLAEVAGLSSTIDVLEMIVKMLLVVSLSNPLASPSLAILLKDPDPQNTMYTVLNLVNVMTFWALAVRSLGLSRLAGVSFGRAALGVFGAWMLLMTVLIVLGGIVQAAFGQ